MNTLTHKTPKIGLALSGGAARGIAHIGVLKALEEESIPIDMIAGTSVGAAVGACYAKEESAAISIAILEEIIFRVNWKTAARFTDLNLLLPGKGFVQGRKIKSLLSSIIGDAKFEDLRIPFAVVAADVQSMEEIVINKGPVVEAVRASISMPVIFTPVRWGGRFLIDGGVVNPVPVDVVRSMGAEIVIAVNVLGVAQPQKGEKAVEKKVEMKPRLHLDGTRLSVVSEKINDLLQEHKDRIKIFDELALAVRTRIDADREEIDAKTPNVFDVLMKLISAMEYERMKSAIKAADIVIGPDVSHIGTFGFHKGEEAVTLGYDATKDILPQLREMIRCP